MAISERDGQSADHIEDFNSNTAEWSPAGAVAEQVESVNRIKDPDNVVAICSECHSSQPEAYIERNPFAHEGKPVPCKYCGGICVITYGEIQDKVVQSIDTARGIGN